MLLRVVSKMRRNSRPPNLFWRPDTLSVSNIKGSGGFGRVYRCALTANPNRVRDFDVLLGESDGNLKKLYAAAEAAFVGGSWVRHGGQNPIEAGFLKVSGAARSACF